MPAVRTLFFLAVLLIPVSASAVTVHDIIELTRAGLPDDILVELIDADRTVFTLDKDQILELKKAGVSKAVLLKMLRSRREFGPAAEPAPQETAPVVTDAQTQPGLVIIGNDPPPSPVTVVVPQTPYFYVPYPIWGVPSGHGRQAPPQPVFPGYRGFGRFLNDGWVEPRRRH